MTYKRREELVSKERVRRLLSYDPETGSLTWRVSTGRCLAGKRAGSRNGARLVVQVDGVAVFAHRAAWMLATGDWPTGVIDHIDGNPSNNRFSNLRDVSTSLNAQNQRTPSVRNQVAALGVGPSRTRFRARIWIDGRDVHIGVFRSAEEAHEAYVKVKRALHPGCTL